MVTEHRNELNERIDKIEAAYEYMLAYAAQGIESSVGTTQGQEVTAFLHDIETALDGLAGVVTAVAEAKNAEVVDTYRSFIDALEADALKTLGAVRLVLAQGSISSLLIDNLNASIHLRALLTDLFVFDEALK